MDRDKRKQQATTSSSPSSSPVKTTSQFQSHSCTLTSGATFGLTLSHTLSASEKTADLSFSSSTATTPRRQLSLDTTSATANIEATEVNVLSPLSRALAQQPGQSQRQVTPFQSSQTSNSSPSSSSIFSSPGSSPVTNWSANTPPTDEDSNNLDNKHISPSKFARLALNPTSSDQQQSSPLPLVHPYKSQLAIDPLLPPLVSASLADKLASIVHEHNNLNDNLYDLVGTANHNLSGLRQQTVKGPLTRKQPSALPFPNLTHHHYLHQHHPQQSPQQQSIYSYAINGTTPVGRTGNHNPFLSMNNSVAIGSHPSSFLHDSNTTSSTLSTLSTSSSSLPLDSSLTARAFGGLSNHHNGVLSASAGAAASATMPQMPLPPRKGSMGNTSVHNRCNINTNIGNSPANYPSRSRNGKYELKILSQPEEQHRARYLTEGSRGAIKDKSGHAYPVIKLCGYSRQPIKIQCFIGHEKHIGTPHLFYQASKIAGKNSTSCIIKKVDGTCIIVMEASPANNMEVNVDCIGILKASFKYHHLLLI